MTPPADELRTAAAKMRSFPGPAAEPIAKLLEETADHMEWGSGTEGVPTIDATIAVARAINGAAPSAPADRPAILREAADALDADMERFFTEWPDEPRNSPYALGRKDAANRLRRMAVEAPAPNRAGDETPSSTAPLAAGFPLVKGNCPACRRASLFLGSGGYVTCSSADCPEPDAATTVLEQYANEAQPPHHRWYVETRDGVADQWAPGSRILDRHHAVERYEALNENHPTWKDGTPVERRIVRETTTYTVEATDAEGVG